MRVAWFTPLSPVRSGISAYSADVLPALGAAHEITVFVEQRCSAGRTPLPPSHPVPGTTLADAHDFVWRHCREPYDLIVYQMGNATCHDYMWPYVTRYPGLVVLHDGVLHHSRALRLLRTHRPDDYRAEFRFAHPDVDPEVAEFGVAGFGGASYYFYPMVRPIAEAARMIGVHSRWLAEELRERYPAVAIELLRMGVPDPLAGRGETPTACEVTEDPARRIEIPVGSPPADQRAREADRRQNARAEVLGRHGIPEDAIVFAAFGLVTEEKRISQAFRALAALRQRHLNVHLLLVGGTVPHYDAEVHAQEFGVRHLVTVTGFVPESQMSAYLSAPHVCLCQRWPSARETSASWLRCLAAGKPTVITDLVQTADVPALDPRTWEVVHGIEEPAPPDARIEPICVSIDILDEDHSLRLAMDRLARDPDLRNRLGRNGRGYWERHHTLASMAEDYLRLMDRAASTSDPRTELPAHLRIDGSERARELIASAGVGWDALGF